LRGIKVGQMSGGTRTVRVSTAVKVAKEKKSKKGASAVKGKKTPEYGVMTSPPQVMIRVMIRHKKQQRGITPSRIYWRRSKRRTR